MLIGRPASGGLKLQHNGPLTHQIVDRQATLYVAASTICMAYGGILGPASILAFYAMWLPRLRHSVVLSHILRRTSRITLLFILWACVSVSWSPYVGKSLYSVLEYSSLVLCTLIMSSLVSTRAFLHGLIVGSTLVLLASLMFGRYAVDPFSDSSSLVGLFGSKNVVGLFAELLILASVVAMIVSRGIVGRLFLCAGPMLLGVMCLIQSKSATSVLSLAGAVAVVCVIYGLMRLPHALRMLGMTLLPAWALLLFGAAYMLDVQDDILRLFGKSSTLTGRTFLWKQGIAYGWDSFVIGHGYAAFWTQGNIPAEHLWYKFGIVNRAGFHFHNLYVQAFVDLGAIGMCLIGLLHIRTLFASLFAAALRGMWADTTMSLAFSTMFFIRSFTEVDILGTFSIGPMVFYAILPRVSRSGSASRPEGS